MSISPKVTFDFTPPPPSASQPAIPKVFCDVAFGPTAEFSGEFDGNGTSGAVELRPRSSVPIKCVIEIAVFQEFIGSTVVSGRASGSLFVPASLTSLAIVATQWNFTNDSIPGRINICSLNHVTVSITADGETLELILLPPGSPQLSGTPSLRGARASEAFRSANPVT